MPDLLTHLTTSYLLKRVVSPNRAMVAFLAGATLPDMISYIPLILWGRLNLQSAPCWLHSLPSFFFPFHSIFGFTLLSYLLALLFSLEVRREIFWNLEIGGMLHFGVDLLQAQHHESSYLLFPFSTRSFALNLIGTESSLYLLPVFVTLTAIVCLSDQIRKRRAD